MLFIKDDSLNSYEGVDLLLPETAIERVNNGEKIFQRDDDGKMKEITLSDFVNEIVRYRETANANNRQAADMQAVQAELEQSHQEQEKLRDSIAELTSAIAALVDETEKAGEVK